MSQQAVWNIEIRHMRVFIALATERNFTRAADRLCMSQPALSRAVAQMEHLLGERLFNRTHQTVTLTAAGSRLLPHAQLVILSLEDAVRAARGETSRLRLGFTWNSSFAEIPLIVQKYEQRNDGASVDLACLDQPFRGLVDGLCDLEFVRDLGPPSGIDSALLFREPRVAALPVGHRLSGKPEVDAEDIQDEASVVVIGNTESVDLGFASGSVEVVNVRNVDEWLIAIGAGRGIGITEKSNADFHRHPLVHMAELRGVPLASLSAAWLRAAWRVDIDELVQTALTLTRRRRQSYSAAALLPLS